MTQTWASYDLPTTLAGNGWQSQFAYGPGRNRWKQVATSSGGTVTTTYIGGLLEKVVRGTLTEWRHQVATPTGLAAVYSRRSDGSADTYYLTTDHLGSTDRVLRAAGGTVQVAESFGAFGARRGSDWSGSPSTSDWTAIGNTTRNGFTGHEHLDNVNLIHMNGRVYDPVVGRFMSVDPVVDPGYSQDLNGYSYAWNSPLSVVDPSGYEETPPELPEIEVFGCRDPWICIKEAIEAQEIRDLLSFELIPDPGYAFADSDGNGEPDQQAASPQKCVGLARVLQGNIQHSYPPGSGRGGFNTPRVTIRITTTSAAVIPRQWGPGLHGGARMIRRNAYRISGSYAGGALFDNIADVIDNSVSPIPGMSTQDAFLNLNPGMLILELVGAERDLGRIVVEIRVPQGVTCPAGTAPASR